MGGHHRSRRRSPGGVDRPGRGRPRLLYPSVDVGCGRGVARGYGRGFLSTTSAPGPRNASGAAERRGETYSCASDTFADEGVPGDSAYAAGHFAPAPASAATARAATNQLRPSRFNAAGRAPSRSPSSGSHRRLLRGAPNPTGLGGRLPQQGGDRRRRASLDQAHLRYQVARAPVMGWSSGSPVSLSCSDAFGGS